MGFSFDFEICISRPHLSSISSLLLSNLNLFDVINSNSQTHFFLVPALNFLQQTHFSWYRPWIVISRPIFSWYHPWIFINGLCSVTCLLWWLLDSYHPGHLPRGQLLPGRLLNKHYDPDYYHLDNYHPNSYDLGPLPSRTIIAQIYLKLRLLLCT